MEAKRIKWGNGRKKGRRRENFSTYKTVSWKIMIVIISLIAQRVKESIIIEATMFSANFLLISDLI